MNTVAKRDYYEVLGIDRNADISEVKRAYRRLAMEYHPDRNPDDPNAEEKFKEASEAFDVLSNDDKRHRYDQFGHQGVEGMASGFNPFANGAGLHDILNNLDSVFGDMFQDVRYSRRRGLEERGSDLQYSLSITLEQAVKGDKIQIKIPTYRTCGDCHGSGAARGSSRTTCTDCNGTGMLQSRQDFFFVQRTCGRCRGAGEVLESPCDKCRGQGRIHTERELSITIPPGVDQGTRLRLSGEGQSGLRGGPSGDLYVEFSVKPHKVFERQNNNLLCEVPITFTQAALGSEVEIPTLQGHVKLRIPSETQTGKLFRLRGRGVPSLRGGGRGDLLCRVVVETPVKLSSHQRELLEELESTVKSSKKHTPKGSSFFKSVKEFIDRITPS